MRLKNRLAILMAERDIRSIAELQRKMDDIGCHAARRTLDRFYKNENNQIHYDTIIGLCRVLECEPGDLFTLVEDNQ